MRILIVTENMSLKMGGESQLPLLHFRRMLQWGEEAYVVCHARCPKCQQKVRYSPQRVNEFRDILDAALEQVADALAASQKLHRMLDLDVS